MNERLVKSREDRQALFLRERLEQYSGDKAQLLSPEDELLLRSYGIYTQRPADAGFFMVRIPIPGGQLDANQLSVISEVTDEFGRGFADITVRQSIQLHWVRLPYLLPLFGRLAQAGFLTADTRSDSVRNIVNCPVSGVDEDELFDTSPLVREVNDFFSHSGEFADLPRKFRMAISGCARHCVYPEINDIGIFAVPDYELGGAAFRVRVGGGLSGAPRFGRDLGVLAGPDDLVELCAAIALTLKEDAEKDSGIAPHFVVCEPHIEEFVRRLETRLHQKLRRDNASVTHVVKDRDRSHVGIHGQLIPGLYYIGLSTLGGRVSSLQLDRLAEIASSYGSGRVRTANTQDIVLLDVPEWNLETVCDELQLAGLDYEPSHTRRSVIACSGIEFCKQALAETKSRAGELCHHLEREVELDEPVRISVTGCPNSCGQHHISDIGLEGSTLTIDGVKHESFQIILGGGVGKIESFGRRIGVRVPSENLSRAVRNLLSSFKNRRFENESFQEFCRRHTDRELAGFLEAEVWQSRTEIGGIELPDSSDRVEFPAVSV